MLVQGLAIGIGIFLTASFFTILVSVTWNLFRRYGLLHVVNVLYLGVSPVVFVFLCLCALFGMRMGSAYFALFEPRMPRMQRPIGAPTGWPTNPLPTGGYQMPMMPIAPAQTRHIELPAGANDPNHPGFYRVNLAELQSSDADHRRSAAAQLSRLRKEAPHA